jgi:hypothetical protein
MVRVGDVLGDFLWHGGLLSQALLVLALLGLLLALASAVVAFAFRRAAFVVGTAALLAGALVMGLGAVASFRAQGQADQRAAAADLEPVRERVRREGYEAARATSIAGLLLGIFPLISGAAAVLASGAQRPRALRRRSPEAPSPPGSRWRLGIGGLPALAALALAGIAAGTEIPGRDLDKPAWDLLVHEAQIKAGEMAAGCSGLERDLRSLGRAEAEPITRDLVSLTDACLRHHLDASSDRAAAAAELLRASPLVIDEAQRNRLRREAAPP